MRKYGMIIAVCLLVVVNAVVLGGIAYNRSGEPAATITLTERELPLISYYSYSDRENTGLSLRLDWLKDTLWTYADDDLPNSQRWWPLWFDKAKLESIGFDCRLPLDVPNAELHYQKMLPRKTYAVLEFEGAAWEAWLAHARAGLAEEEMRAQKGEVTQESLKKSREDFEREYRTRSRLFVIDAGNDLVELRKQYMKLGRYLILPATVRLEYYRPYTGDEKKKAPPRLIGHVVDILTDTIYVPKEERPILEKLLSRRAKSLAVRYEPYTQPERGPFYRVKINVGKRDEPWIAAVQELLLEKPK
jgi:hypothetical protein